MSRRSMVTSIACLGVAAWLAGKVTVGQEALEGVLVSAKKNGSTITITVVSGKDGRYSFPAAILDRPLARRIG